MKKAKQELRIEVLAAILAFLLFTALPALLSQLFLKEDILKREYPPSYVTVMRVGASKPLEIEFEELVTLSCAAFCTEENGEEAVKALAVAIRSRLFYRYIYFENGEYDLLLPRDAFVNRESLCDSTYSYIRAAVDKTSSLVLIYEGEPIWAATHKESGISVVSSHEYAGVATGYLEASETVELPSVNEHFVSYSAFAAIAYGIFGVNSLGGDEKLWIEGEWVEKSGAVSAISVSGKRIEAEDFCKAFGLESRFFDYSFNGEGIIFKVYGEGSSVGMSRRGAEILASRGKSFEEILEYYFSKAELCIFRAD